MKTLIAEDDYTSRRLLERILSAYGQCDIAVDGTEAIRAVETALAEQYPYDLICMDVMMPKVDGNEALEKIRALERRAGIPGARETKVIMITALGDPKSVVKSLYKAGATVYVVKPVAKRALLEELRRLGLIE